MGKVLRDKEKNSQSMLVNWRTIVASHTYVYGATRVFLKLALLLGLFTPCALGEARMYCYQKVIEPGATGGGRVRVAGFTVEVKPIAHPDDAESTLCHASVTAPDGRIAYSSNDWGAEIDHITGKDVNGDGEPDAVLVSYSGGAHRCWTYHIISLGKKPGLLREFQNRDTASFEDLKGNGQVEIVIRDGTFDFGFGLDHAFSVFPLLVVRLRGTEFIDVSSDFWPMFQKEISEERDGLSDDRVQELLHPRADADGDDFERSITKSRVLLTAIDYVYGGRHEEAKRLLNVWWPKDSQEQTWNEIVTGYCSGLRSELGVATRVPCAAK